MQYIDKNQESGIIRYTYDNSLYGFIQIEYAFRNENRKLNKFLTITKDSDIKISGISLDDNKQNNMDFNILEDDIIYPLFIKFMRNDEILLIESDDEREYNMKYVMFEKLDRKIRITIVNKKENASLIDKFNCFIKNTEIDMRSKIDKSNLDYKKRFLNLFDDIQMLFEQTNDKKRVKEYKIN